MAMTTAQQTDAYRFFSIAFDAAPGVTYMNQLADAYAAGMSTKEIVNVFTTKEQFTNKYPTFLSNDAFAASLIAKVVGASASDAAKAEAVADVAAALNAGWSRGDIIFQVFTNLAGKAADDATWGNTAKLMANKVAVAKYVTETALTNTTDLAVLAKTLSGVTASTDVSTPAALAAAASLSSGSASLTLTQNADNLTGTAGNDVFLAPVTQNVTGSGALANTFETGDVLAGGAGVDVLRADLIDTGTIQDGQTSVAISATTTGIEQVFLRAQRGATNNTIDAEKMEGVQQWWTDNSRANITIEDIRSDTSSTTFGMRQTDPGVGYNAFFNARFLEGDTSATSALSLNIYQGPAGAPNAVTQLANITVREIAFSVGGTAVTLDTPAIRAANTWVELEAALKTALLATPAASDVTLTHRGNGQFLFEDATGREFGVKPGEALVLSVINNITVTNSVTVGREVAVGPVISSAVLDGAGNGSQGGALNLGAMSGLRGVEELNVSVDRESHIQSITSFNQTPGQYVTLRNGDANEFLQTVNLTSIGAKGDLTIGRSTANLDGRVANWSNFGGVINGGANSGFVNIRTLNTTGFEGALTTAITLDNNAIGRYLDAATGEVQFAYQGTAKADNFSIADVSTGGALSGDADFAMDVTLGAGNDRLNLNVATVSNVVVDGGTGTNTIAVAQSHGMTAGNTFEGFSNFQTYEVEGVVGATQHDFTSMTGVTTVNVATGGFASTELRDLPAANGVVVTGKNQTLANNSNANQTFNVIAINGADATATDTTMRVTLENTARLNGTLTVNQLSIGDIPATATAAADVNPIRTLELVSGGQRSAANVVADINAALVNNFNLSGTQNLTTAITAAANSTAVAASRASMVVDGTALTGALDLTLTGALVTAVDAGTSSTVTLRGTAGATDTLRLTGAMTTTNDTTVAGFETVQFTNAASGTFDGSNVTGVTVFDINNTGGALSLIDMLASARINVNINAAGTVVGDALVFDAASQATTNVLDLEFRDADTSGVNNFTAFGAAPISSRDYNTVSLDLGGYAGVNEAYTFDLRMQDAEGDDEFAAGGVAPSAAGDVVGVYDAASAYARKVVVIGGGDQGAAGIAGGVDSVDLGTLTNVISSVDVSAYVGRVALNVVAYTDAVVDRNVTITLNGYGAQLSESILGGGADGTIVTYAFTRDAVAATEDVVITGFGGFNVVGNDLTNLSVLDVSALGVKGLANLTLTAAADVDTFTAGAQAGVLITSNEGLNFEIGLVGVALADLSNENFKFAA